MSHFEDDTNPDDLFFDSEDFEIEESILSSIESENKESDSQTLPNQLHILPLNKRLFFPGMAAPIIVEPGKFYQLLKHLTKSNQKHLGLVLTKEENEDLSQISFSNLYSVGVIARILRIIPLENGGAQVILNMEKRFKITKPVKSPKYLKAHVEYHNEPTVISKDLKAYSISVISTIKKLIKLNPLFKEELQIFLGHSDFTDPGKLADFSVALTTAAREELQEVLETFDLKERIDKVLLLLKKEMELSIMLNSINEKIEGSIQKNQKEYYLREQLRAIKKELALEKDEKTCDLEKFRERLKQRKVPEDVLKAINEEMDKLQSLETQSSEYSVCRGYLDWLTIIPWGIYGQDNYDLSHAEKILQKDHYGLQDIKERILEFISVGKLSGSIRGSILCLVGPPGVGKTSIGKSIARALDRKFYRFSVGGMRDEAEIKRHRRTYVGAMPGKLIQALKYSGVMNPVIMLDEVDKMGSSYQGDPASALLEVLDREQNTEFLDHYLDVRVDLSDVLFIVTANVLDTIPSPLKDRMDILRLSGYILEEKVQIAKRYLIPKNRKDMGLKAKHVDFSTEALHDVIHGYARESGVRSLENYIKKILRKIATKIVKKAEVDTKNKKGIVQLDKIHSRYRISHSTLKTYLGKPVFTSDRYYTTTPVGVSMGLAWTSLGGATLYVEATKVNLPKKIEMKLTGQAGDVMKESSQIAWTYLHSNVHRYHKAGFFNDSQVHIHIPEGATPKDGPSAGITMVTSLISLLFNEPILNNLGMTGELTLTGRVLPIGGLKEKIIAAKRAHAEVLIFPEDNLHDYEELPDHLKKGLKVHFVKHYDEVFKIAFPKRKTKQK